MLHGTRKTLRLHISGRGGDGNISMGEVLAKCLARFGYHVFSFRTYPAEIEGGVSQFVLKIGIEEVLSLGSGSELAAVLSQEAFDDTHREYRSDALVLHEANLCRKVEPFRALSVEAVKAARWTFGNPKLKNLILLGALAKLLGIEPQEMGSIAEERYHKIEDKSLVDKTVAYGANLVPDELTEFRLAPPTATPRMVLTGNQAVSLGAIRAGCNFVAGYPITPASPMLEYLAKVLPGMGGTVIQTEDEMAAIGACIGASYVGSKAMTTTSGPGFALMSEMVNLAVMTEVPLVIVDVQRAGPSTGMPSKTEQGDLLFAMFGSPGESPRIVLAASDVQDAYYQAVRAFNLAETLQCPVVLLTDQSLAYRNETVDPNFGHDQFKILSRLRKNGELPAEYRRFLMTDSGASPASLPGGSDTPFMTTGLEHDEFGRENYSPENHRSMTAKRYRKLETAARLAAEEERDFEKPAKARVGVLGWGSTRGAILESCRELSASGASVARMHLHTLRPLPEKQLLEFTENLDRLVVVEENYSAQLAMLVRGVVECEVVAVNKCEGLPFHSAELVNKIGATI